MYRPSAYGLSTAVLLAGSLLLASSAQAITIKDPCVEAIAFADNSATLSQEAIDRLNSFAMECPKIFGHVVNLSSQPNGVASSGKNEKLSRMRIEAVRDYLIALDLHAAEIKVRKISDDANSLVFVAAY